MSTKKERQADPKNPEFAGPCPRCGQPVPNKMQKGEYPGALSRFDNETFVCSDCGTQEALYYGHLIPTYLGLFSEAADRIRTEHGVGRSRFDADQTSE